MNKKTAAMRLTVAGVAYLLGRASVWLPRIVPALMFAVWSGSAKFDPTKEEAVFIASAFT
jgi:hypothetical protein